MLSPEVDDFGCVDVGRVALIASVLEEAVPFGEECAFLTR